MIKKYLIIGQGRIGYALTVMLASQNPDVSIIALATSPKSYPYHNICFWQKNALMLDDSDLVDITHIAIIITPNTKNTDKLTVYKDSYQAICQYLAGLNLPKLVRIVFVSSTAVYGQNNGEVLDIRTPVYPVIVTAQVLYDAERILQDRFGDKCIIVRPSGIYGLLATRMIDIARFAHTDGVPACHYTNRIMDSDLVRVLYQILIGSEILPVYIASDFCPVTSLEVVHFIRGKLSLNDPVIIHDSAPTGKRILTNVPSDWLVFKDYRAGFSWILDKKRTNINRCVFR